MSIYLVAEIIAGGTKPDILRVFLCGENAEQICRDGRPVTYATLLSVNTQRLPEGAVRRPAQEVFQEEVDLLRSKLHKTREYHWVIPFLSAHDKHLLRRKS